MTNDAAYLHHILGAIAKIETYVSGGRDEFMSQSHWQDAVIRQLEIIGEATKQVSAELRAQHSDLPWRRIAGLRDVLIHHYFGVDLETVWQITQTRLPAFKRRIQGILNGLESNP